MLDFEIKETGNVSEIAISGRLTFDVNLTFRRIVQAVAQGGGRAVSIDLSRLEFIDSAGLGMLLLLREAAKDASAKLWLTQPCGQVQRLLSVSHFHRLIPIEGTEGLAP
ncbi:MAG TPA: STAS domain-containing protein [Patescibacteria group bacterium]|nr:STAS domain-containing protein [Patescibacteria group bacterium]